MSENGKHVVFFSSLSCSATFRCILSHSNRSERARSNARSQMLILARPLGLVSCLAILRPEWIYPRMLSCLLFLLTCRGQLTLQYAFYPVVLGSLWSSEAALQASWHTSRSIVAMKCAPRHAMSFVVPGKTCSSLFVSPVSKLASFL